MLHKFFVDWKKVTTRQIGPIGQNVSLPVIEIIQARFSLLISIAAQNTGDPRTWSGTGSDTNTEKVEFLKNDPEENVNFEFCEYFIPI